MITLGITGRSGCGKSTVTAVFAAHGVPLADADQLSREILLPGSPLLPQLAARFGGDILKPDGTLDRRLLADRAFATPEGKAALDSLTHPAIVARIRAAKQAAQAAGWKKQDMQVLIDKNGNVEQSMLEPLMPWSKTLPADCYSKRRK